MQTECPHCNTIFRVKESELEQADGQVRCGHCLAVFTADNPYSTTTYRTESDPDNNFEESDSFALKGETESEDSHLVADVIPPELRAEARKGKNHFGFLGTLVISLLILTSISGLFLQYAYYNRNNLVKITDLRPWLETMCQQINCTLPPPRDRKKIILSSKNIFSHPNVEGALMVSASIVNQADFAQEYPIIELRFENVRGKTIAGRRFNAVEYLGIPEDQISQMQPDIPININLEIKDPGNNMVSYEFSFL